MYFGNLIFSIEGLKRNCVIEQRFIFLLDQHIMQLIKYCNVMGGFMVPISQAAHSINQKCSLELSSLLILKEERGRH